MPKDVAERDRALLETTHGRPDFCKPREQPLEVMILGLSRTGTSSLREAFLILGYGTVYGSRELFGRHQMRFAAAGLNAKYALQGRRFGLEQFESMWGEYRAISGEPVVPHAEELIDLYPDAKIILTVRDDEEKWLSSLTDTMWRNNIVWTTRFLKLVDPKVREMRVFMDPWWWYVYWDDLPTNGVRVYREHNAMVQRKAAKERLLVYNAKEGWEPLCRFLGKDVPNVPFPNVNQREDYWNIFHQIRNNAMRGVLRTFMLRVAFPVLILGIAIRTRARLRAALRALQMWSSYLNWK